MLKFIALITTYCFALCMVTQLLVPIKTNDCYSFSQEKKEISFSAKLYYPSPVLENINSSNSQNLPVVDIKKTDFNFLASLKKQIHLFRVKVNQSVFFTRNTIVLYRKSDLIFPFQYFW